MISTNKKIEYLVSVMALLALLGLGDATYLTITHYTASPATCIMTSGCDAVLKSSYAVLWELPIALLGIIYYVTVFAAALGCLNTQNRRWLFALLAMVPIGFLASLYFLYIQAVVIGAYCSLCLFSAALSTLLLVGGIVLLRYIKIKKYEQELPQNRNTIVLQRPGV